MTLKKVHKFACGKECSYISKGTSEEVFICMNCSRIGSREAHAEQNNIQPNQVCSTLKQTIPQIKKKLNDL